MGGKRHLESSSQTSGPGKKEACGETGCRQCVFSAELPGTLLAEHTGKASRTRRRSNTRLGGSATAVHPQVTAGTI